MIGWGIAILTLAWAVYQHFHPRILCKVHYQIGDVQEDNHPAKLTIGDLKGVYDGSSVSPQRYVNLVGKVIEIRSVGNIAARGILVHIKLKYPIYSWKIETDEKSGKPYGEDGEFNIKVECLNPTDVLRVLVFCDKAEQQDELGILIEHRITLNEGKARQVKHW